MDTTEQAQYSLEQIIETMYDFSDYSPEEKEMVVDETVSMITEAALMRGLDQSSESVQDAFNEFIETHPNEVQMIDFIEKNIPNFQALVVEEISIFDTLGTDKENT
jgi:hypothetical protein